MTVSPLAAAAATGRAERPAPSAASRPVAAVEAGAFEKAMPAAPSMDGAAVGDTDFHHQSSRSAELRPLQKFESFVLRSFIENMLPSQNTSFFGTGTAGNIWRSMLAERIGDEMAKSGGVGIARMIEENRRGEAPVSEGQETI